MGIFSKRKRYNLGNCCDLDKKDICDLVDLFRQHCSDVSLWIDKQPIQQFDDLEHFPKPLASSLKIVGLPFYRAPNKTYSKRMLELEVGFNSASLYIPDELTTPMGTFVEQVKNLFSSRERRWRHSTLMFSFMPITLSYMHIQQKFSSTVDSSIAGIVTMLCILVIGIIVQCSWWIANNFLNIKLTNAIYLDDYRKSELIIQQKWFCWVFNTGIFLNMFFLPIFITNTILPRFFGQ